jgi:hypothetical protein
MRGLVVCRWLTPAAFAALLCIPMQIATGHPMGGRGHSMGRMGGNRMGSHSAMASRSLRNRASRFAQRPDPARFERERREGEEREEREFFFRLGISLNTEPK